MKKKGLTMLLALAISASFATVTVGCDGSDHVHTYATEWTADDTYHWKVATCEHTTEIHGKTKHDYGADGKCTVCQKEKSLALVTQEEWVAFFDLLPAMSLEAEVNISAMNINQTVLQHDNVLYQTQTREGTTQQQYVCYDDTTHTMVRYSNHNGEWKKYTTVFDNAEEYANSKALYMGLAETAFGGDYSVQQSGAGDGLRDLYSAFTYNSNTRAYTANLYYVEVGYDMETSQNTYYYSEAVWAIKFESGKIVSASLTQTALGQSMTLDFTCNYNVTELIIPTEVLNAPENI